MDVLLFAAAFIAGYAFRGVISKEIKASGAEVAKAVASLEAAIAKKL